MTAKQMAALKRGREKKAARQRAEAIRRVKAFEAWLAAGSNLSTLGKALDRIPTDGEYALAREAGATTR